MPQLLLVDSKHVGEGLNDYRNLLLDVMRKSWGPSILLDGIMARLPEFLVRLEQADEKALSLMGTYHE